MREDRGGVSGFSGNGMRPFIGISLSIPVQETSVEISLSAPLLSGEMCLEAIRGGIKNSYEGPHPVPRKPRIPVADDVAVSVPRGGCRNGEARHVGVPPAEGILRCGRSKVRNGERKLVTGGVFHFLRPDRRMKSAQRPRRKSHRIPMEGLIPFPENPETPRSGRATPWSGCSLSSTLMCASLRCGNWGETRQSVPLSGGNRVRWSFRSAEWWESILGWQPGAPTFGERKSRDAKDEVQTGKTLVSGPQLIPAIWQVLPLRLGSTTQRPVAMRSLVYC
jgi:hypothetical protein